MGQDEGGASNPKRLFGALLKFLSVAFNQRQAVYLCPPPFFSLHSTVSEDDYSDLLCQSQKAELNTFNSDEEMIPRGLRTDADIKAGHPGRADPVTGQPEEPRDTILLGKQPRSSF